MPELKSTQHNIRCRENMRRDYYENDGRIKSLLKYYKRLYKFPADFFADCASPAEQIVKVKTHHFQQKIQTFLSKE